MSTILDTIAEHARERVAEAKEQQPFDQVKAQALELAAKQREAGMPQDRFEAALRQGSQAGEIAFICECKKASPSKGVIAQEFPYLDIARSYEAAGAAAISVLTEPKWFLGADEYLTQIAAAVDIPCLRKDFVVDAYQIYEAKLLGASAVLLICAILDDQQLTEYHAIAEELGLSALVETHDEEEIRRALGAGARIIGVNNRNLKNFQVDVGLSGYLRNQVPEEVIFVAESGIKGPANMVPLYQAHVNAVLVGEACMRSADKAAFLADLRGAKQEVISS